MGKTRIDLPLPDALAETPELAIVAGPIVTAAARTADDLLLHALPAGREVRVSGPVALSTVSGWPLTVQRADVLDGNVVCEVRIVARYDLALLAAFVQIHASDAATLERELDTLLEVLANATFDLASDSPAAIAELWRS